MMIAVARKLVSTFTTRKLNSSIVKYYSQTATNVIDVGGMSPPIPTPFRDDGEIYYDQLAQNFEKWNKISFRGYVIQGSNGEYPYLTTAERVDLVKFSRQMIPKEKLLIAGSGCESTTATIKMTEDMAKNGADVALVITPFYYKSGMTLKALAQHYEQLADSSPIPILVYNVPVNTGLDLPVDTIVRLSQHRNIIGMKDSNGDVSKLASVVRETGSSPGGFQVLAGSASFLLPAHSVGCVGGICALANVIGSEVCKLQELFKSGRLEEAKLLQQRLVAPNMAVTKQYGVPGLKAALDAYGYFGGIVRSPLLDLDDVKREEVISIFRKNDFHP